MRRRKHSYTRFIVIVILCIIGATAHELTKTVGHKAPDKPIATYFTQLSDSPTQPTYTPYTGTISSSLFVPYWNIPTSLPSSPLTETTQTELIYFGIKTTNGTIDTTDPGYTSLTQFTTLKPKRSLLTLRMLNATDNRIILEDPAKQTQLIQETLDLVQNHSFDGIVLDFEHSVLPTKDVTDQITSFIQQFSQGARENNQFFGITLYGDTYYRARPYDVARLAPHVDMMYIMAYDLHKPFGEPGPNFPRTAGTIYGYSLDDMLTDFGKDVPHKKLAILFGFYGYDWSVDDQNRPATGAIARPLTQIQDRFYPTCIYKSCTIYHDPISSETRITYTDTTQQKHVLWYEDQRSIRNKIKLVRSFGVGNIGYWVYGYY